MTQLASKIRRSARGRARAALHAVLCIGAAGAAAANGAATQPLESIRGAAQAFVRSQMPPGQSDIVITVAGLDPRLRLAHCAAPLQTSLLSGMRMQAQVSVAVGCHQGAQWTIYVPVMVQSRIRVWALRTPEMQGARLTAGDVAPETRLVGGLPVGYLTDPTQLGRATLRHSLPAGAVLTADDLLADFMVRQGEQVTMVAAVDGIEVRAAGLALQNGRQGALIRVQNATSSKVVQGVVEGDRVVDVSP
ncbi:MAG TPA: flagellar basal body P-ring formation chaperone FlgA [Steroidobacteraceae bacterium]|nr:flagellar basal body P-ring formation chaperone FlgA [Steroidobacteraceae bacterium]